MPMVQYLLMVGAGGGGCGCGVLVYYGWVPLELTGVAPCPWCSTCSWWVRGLCGYWVMGVCSACGVCTVTGYHQECTGANAWPVSVAQYLLMAGALAVHEFVPSTTSAASAPVRLGHAQCFLCTDLLNPSRPPAPLPARHPYWYGRAVPQPDGVRTVGPPAALLRQVGYGTAISCVLRAVYVTHGAEALQVPPRPLRVHRRCIATLPSPRYPTQRTKVLP